MNAPNEVLNDQAIYCPTRTNYLNERSNRTARSRNICTENSLKREQPRIETRNKKRAVLFANSSELVYQGSTEPQHSTKEPAKNPYYSPEIPHEYPARTTRRSGRISLLCYYCKHAEQTSRPGRNRESTPRYQRRHIASGPVIGLCQM